MKNHIMTTFLGLFICLGLISGTVDLDNLFNYENQFKPIYLTKDNTTQGNELDDKITTLGRVLFYDKNLSLNKSKACSSCHIQEFAFGDTAQLSVGFEGGLTGRHSMRLINVRFADEVKFFWDERAVNLEDQTTRPIQDHIEMGFSGNDGQPSFDSLISRLSNLEHYQTLFEFAFGDNLISEERIQKALGQFVGSIQSVDSKFDIGRAQAPNDAAPFPNFSNEENLGKQLFLAPPPNGAGCQGCHRAPEFDIDPNTLNNGIIGVAGSPGTFDFTNTKAPTLRDLFNPNGNLNGPLMHNGIFTDINQVINHYNLVPQNPQNINLDPRLQGPGGDLQLTNNEKNALIAFLRTLTGSAVYTDERWSNPFDENGQISVVKIQAKLNSVKNINIQIYPNPCSEFLFIQNIPSEINKIEIIDMEGRVKESIDNILNKLAIPVLHFKSGTYKIRMFSKSGNIILQKSFIKY